MLRKNKGFTLVELLIVIVVIGILSAMMMMSSNEAVSSARAATIIADLTNLKNALMIWHTDNYDKIEHDPTNQYAGMILAANNNGDTQKYNPIQETNIMDEIAMYLEGAAINKGLRQRNKEMSEGSYGIYDGGGQGDWHWPGLPEGAKNGRLAWFVGYRFTKSEYKGLRKKLEGRATSLGLIFKGKFPNREWGYGDSYTVWMRVL